MSKATKKSAFDASAAQGTPDPTSAAQLMTTPEGPGGASSGMPGGKTGASGYTSPKLKSEDPDVSELELKLLESGKIGNYILLPSDVTKIWRTTRVKDELVKFL